MHDPRLPLLSETLSNKTARLLLERFSEKPASVSELVHTTSLPFSTVDYTVQKLIQAGLVVKESSWRSVKGKQVARYTLANTEIIISPRPLMKGVLPAVLCSGLFAAFLRFTGITSSPVSDAGFMMGEGSASRVSAIFEGALTKGVEEGIVQPGANIVLPDIALWFLFGSLVGILLLVGWNVILRRMKGGSLS
jgi:DNA-binding transcriptional ArsR family regulator